jgi:Insertion element 4 transposase N-terminal/Transposase DDE domain
LSAYLATGAEGDVTFPLPLIEEAVAATGVAGRRRRLLPGVAVVVFVLGCCLFSGEGYGEVARKLAGWLAPLAGPGGWAVPGSGALARARRRAGPRPLKLLFTALAGPLAGPATPAAYLSGRLVVALDGTMLDVPHTPANIAAFGPPPGAKKGAFPQVRLVTLAACGTRGLLDAAFRGRTAARSSEQDLARTLAARGALRRGMLVLADRNFCGYPVAAVLAATGADFLIRARADQRFPVLEALPDGSYRSVLPHPAAARARWHRNGERRRRGSPLPPDPASTLPGIAVRVIEATITIIRNGEPPRTERYRLITTLTDPSQAPAAQIAACYAQRWEIETSYREIKTFTLRPATVLRSATPAGITQEIWALLCACQLTCTARAQAAQAGGHHPSRISYTVTLRAIRRAITTTHGNITAEALAQLLPPRRHRSHPRLIGTSTAKRRTARAGLTATITYKITITSPPDQPGP